jgi:hypothetical protein
MEKSHYCFYNLQYKIEILIKVYWTDESNLSASLASTRILDNHYKSEGSPLGLEAKFLHHIIQQIFSNLPIYFFLHY